MFNEKRRVIPRPDRVGLKPIRRSDRIGKRSLTVHTDEEIFHHFQRLKADRLSSTDEMMHEALELLFKHYNELENLRRRLAASAKFDQPGDEEALS